MSMGNSFVHGYIHYICIGNSVYFHAQNNDRSLVCANPINIIACANVFLHGQKVVYMRKIRSSSSTRWSHPQELYGWEQSRTLQAQAETANQLYYLQVLSVCSGHCLLTLRDDLCSNLVTGGSLGRSRALQGARNCPLQKYHD